MKVTTSILQNAFGKYLNMVIDGERLTIMKNNKPVAEMTYISNTNTNLLREEAVAYMTDQSVSYSDFVQLTKKEETGNYYEYINGQVYAMTSPLFQHQAAVTHIMGQLYQWFKDKPCRLIVSPFDVRLHKLSSTFEEDPNIVQPDIVVICDTEMIDYKGHYNGIPTLVVEVLSKSTKSKDLFIKANLYMNSGVQEYWIIDTDLKQVSVYHFQDASIYENQTFFKNDDIRSFIFKDLLINTQDIFV